MKNIEALKRGAVVSLVRNATTLENTFNAGDQFKFLGWYGGFGNLVRLSRTGDNAKLMVVPADIGYCIAPVQTDAGLQTVVIPKPATKPDGYDLPHSDESGPSRRIVIATVLAGKDSGVLAMHMTPAEEREYNIGMAALAAMG